MRLKLPNLTHYPAISVNNVEAITEIAQLGYGLPRHIQWSPNGQLLAITATTGVCFFNLNEPNDPDYLPIAGNILTTIVISDDVLASFANIKLDFNKHYGHYSFCTWNYITKQPISELELLLPIDVTHYAFDAKLSRLAIANYPQIQLWSLKTGQPLVSLPTGNASVYCLNFSPDGTKLAVGMDDGTVLIWDCEHNITTTLSTSENILLIYEVMFSPDGKLLASGDGNSKVRLWNADTFQKIGSAEGYGGHKGIHSLCFSPDSQWLVFSGQELNLKILNLKENTLKTIQQDDMFFPEGAFSPDSRRVAALYHHQVGIWDIYTGVQQYNLNPQSPVSIAFISGDDRVHVSGKSPYLLKLASGDIEPLPSLPQDIICLSPDGKMLVTKEGRKIHLWDRETGEELSSIETHGNLVSAIQFGPDSRILAIGGHIDLKRKPDSSIIHHSVYLWDLASFRSKRILEDIFGWNLAFSPDGSLLAASGSNDALLLWDMAADNLKAILPLNARHSYIPSQMSYEIAGPVFSSDGRLIAVGTPDNNVQIWDVQNGTRLRIIPTSGWQANCLAFNSDGTVLALTPRSGGSVYSSSETTFVSDGGFGNTIHLWEVATGKELGVLKKHNLSLKNLEFNHNGRVLASCEDGVVRLWGIPTQ